MNLSMKWLRDYINKDIPIKDFCHGMTMSGSKVEGFETEGTDINNVVVGKIVSTKPHQDSDHLIICEVDAGGQDTIQIVTGASNVHEGDLVPVALHGAVLPNGTKIKKGKLRGVESNGMLCSIGELNLTLNDFPYAVDDGIFIMREDCSPGQDIQSAIGLNDTSVEFEITSNRPDCLSVLGLAREASATFAIPMIVESPSYTSGGDDINSVVKINVQNTSLCGRYCAGAVKNVKIQPSPRWMRERLRASGIRPINNLVDITNYVMLEYGQPMHAFDLKYVEGAEINIRNASKGEKIVTLDGIERTLDDNMLIIADKFKPIAVAGVMGGEYSGIMDDTNTVIFESAYFDAVSVRKTAKALGMRTDASARFEKGLDKNITVTALKRAFELVEKLGAGEVCDGIIDCDYLDKAPHFVDFDCDWINSFLGTDIPSERMVEILESLELQMDGGKVLIPSFRIDLECKADIAEEIARIYGYNNIPSSAFRGVADAKLTPMQQFIRKITDTASALGCREIKTYSFISPKYFDKINLSAGSPLRKTVTISNPLGEDTSVMRTTVIPSMLEILSRNYNNRNDSACLFEIGKVYIPDEDCAKLPLEAERLSVGMYGKGSDFYELKGIVEALLDELNINGCTFERCDENYPEFSVFHPGRCAVVAKNDKILGAFGQVHPDVADNYQMPCEVYCAKFDVSMLHDASLGKILYKPLPKFPAVMRDLSLVCNEDIPVARLENAIRDAAGNILEKVTLFDVYRGQQIASGKKSVSYSLTLRSHESTLTDEQADASVKKALDALLKIGAEIRS